MLLVEVTINSVVNYVSIDGHALTNNWRPFVIGFSAPTVSLPSDHGGYAKTSFGNIQFNPQLFVSDYPPPVACPISIYYTDTTEAARELVFEGIAHLTNFNREQISYNLYGPSYDETLIIRGVGPLVTGRSYQIVSYVAGDDFVNVGGTNVTGNIFTTTGTTPTVWTNFSKLAPYWNATLNVVIDDILSFIPEITTVDTTYARASSPNVTYTLTSDRLAINVASDIAEFYSHLIYIDGSTAYLVDMLLDNGTDWTLDEFDFFSMAEYIYKTPLAEIKCSYNSVVYSQISSYSYGTTTTVDPFHTTESNIETALANMLTIENSPRISISIPMIAGNFPRFGQKIIIPDTSHVANLSSWIRVRKLSYDFINDEIIVEGDGEVAAA